MGRLNTRAEFETIQGALKDQMALPADEQDEELITAALVTLRENEDSFGSRTAGASRQAIQEGALASFRQSPELEQLQNIPETVSPGPGIPQQNPRANSLLAQGAIQGAKSAVQGVGDFVARPFRGQEEQEAVAQSRRRENAQVDIAQEEVARRLGVSQGALSTSKFIGSAVPDLALGGVAGSVRGRAGRVAAEAVAGAVTGGGTVQGDEDAGFTAAAFGVGSGALGTALELPGALRDFTIRKARSVRRSAEANEGFAVGERAGIDLTLAEASGSPTVRRMELAVDAEPGTPRARLYKNRREQIKTSLANVTKALNPANLSMDQVVHQTKKAFEGHVKKLGDVASENFRFNIGPAAKAAGATIDNRGRIIGGKKIVPVDNLVKEYRTQAALGLENRSLSEAQSKKLLKEADRLQAEGGMTLGAAQDFLDRLTNRPGGNVVANRVNAADFLEDRTTKAAILDDMKLGETRGGVQAEVATSLRQAREGYKADMAELNALGERQVTELLGKIGDPEAEDFASKLLNLPRSQFKDLMNIAEQASPGMSDAIRGRVFAELVDRHLNVATGALDIPAFLGQLDNMSLSKFQAFAGQNQLSASHYAKVQDGIEALRLIAEGPEGVTQAKGFIQQFEGYAINAISRSGPFMARLVAGEIGPLFLESKLFTKQGLEELAKLGDPRTSRAALLNIFTGWGADLAASDEKVEAARKEAIDAQVVQYQQIGQSAAPF